MEKGFLSLLGVAAVALGTAATAAPAAAQSVVPAAGSPYAVSYNAVRKSEALLGGQSKLAALMAQQGGIAVPAAATAASATAASAGSPAAMLKPARLHTPWSDRTVALASPAIALARPAIARGMPDVFGSVALRVAATPLDRRWQAVADRPAEPEAARWAAALANGSEAERIETVNRFVNARIAFVDDSVQFGRPDVWQSAAEALGRGRGDCEDYAIAKLQLLRAAGFAASDLYLVVLKDLVRRSDHAVLAVRSDGRLWILDNGTDRVVDSADIVDYRPIFTYAAGKSWTHGYRRPAQAPMVLASAIPTERNLPVPASAPAALSLTTSEPSFQVSLADLSPALLS